MTQAGRQALDEAVADTLAGISVQVTIEGGEAGTNYAEGSVGARRAASLKQLLAERGVSDPDSLLAELR